MGIEMDNEVRKMHKLRSLMTTHPIVPFVLKTGFYFVVLIALIYLYGYSGVNNSGFIYNEF